MKRNHGLSQISVDLLLEHALGPRPYRVAEALRLRPLLVRHLIYLTHSKNPKFSHATSSGKDVIIHALAAEADRLDPQVLGLPLESPELQPAEAHPLPPCSARQDGPAPDKRQRREQAPHQS